MAFGEDNVIWGTDSIHYGGAQPLIRRVPHLPDSLRDVRGVRVPEDLRLYEAQDPRVNAARLYGIDVNETRRFVTSDDLAWSRPFRRISARAALPVSRRTREKPEPCTRG